VILEVVILILLALAVLALYFAPTIVAVNRNNPSRWWIFFFNLIFGSTLVGWLIALWWATTQRNSFADTVGRVVMYFIAFVVALFIGVVFLEGSGYFHDAEPAKPKTTNQIRKQPQPIPREDESPVIQTAPKAIET
jgi:hypothetical protein